MQLRLRTVLQEVFLGRCPGIPVAFVDTLPDLTEDMRFQIRQALTDELCETGLDEDDEPNQRGLLLEELIDLVGMPSPLTKE